jgi:hypothetical protein
MFENLTQENYMMFAMKWYSNPHCTDILEFKDDLKRIRYVNRLFYKYMKTGELRERLILNHLVVLYNMFESRALTRILIMQCEEYLHYLKPFLIFLNYWTDDIGLVNGKKIRDSDISLDNTIVEKLRQI